MKEFLINAFNSILVNGFNKSKDRDLYQKKGIIKISLERYKGDTTKKVKETYNVSKSKETYKIKKVR